MRRVVITAALVLAAALAATWALGGFEALARWAAEGQRTAQNAMAGALRALRAGEPGALAGLIGIAFAYGVLHAAGPGHGKVLIGGYGAATSVRLAPLAGIALAASLAQATVAVALVHGGIALFDLGRERVLGLGEGVLLQASAAAIAVIGLWLCLRGARGLHRLLAPGLNRAHAAAGHQHAGHGGSCDVCGHRHAPTPQEVAAATSWGQAAALVGAIAIRPCTGALFLLILTWRMGITAAGIAGAYVMALGTALITVAVAALAVLARDGARHWGGRFVALAPVAPLAELAVGALVVAVALQALSGPF